MIPLHLLLLLLIFFVEAAKKLILHPIQLTTFNLDDSCPKGYRLAILDDPEDWKTATRLALDTLGHNISVWIRFGLGWRGLGNERWSIITPTLPNSCPFPPKDLDSFCIQFDRFRLAPNHGNPQPLLPSICEEIGQS